MSGMGINRPGGRWKLALAVLVLVAAGATAFALWNRWQRRESIADPSATAPNVQPAAAPSAAAEFLAVAERLERSENPYLGTAQVGRQRAKLNAPGISSAQRSNAQLVLAFHLLRLGDVTGAQREIAAALDGVARPSLKALELRALAHLREAETENCVKRHNRDCCIFPLAGGGLHQQRRGAEQAKIDLLAILKRNPNDLKMQWLLNVTAMALGEYPQGVPQRFRIPPESLKSEYDVGRFEDVAPALGVDPLNLCGGAIVEDFNGDGLLDIVTSSYDPREPLRYYRNLGAKGFREETVAAGLEDQLGGLNCIGGDYDNDGDVDVLVLRGAWLEDDGQIRNSLLRNNGADEDGTITFTDVTHEAGIAEPAFPTQAAAWGDFDGDGDLDLFVGSESRVDVAPGSGGNYPCQLFRNNGPGANGHWTFTNIARAAGVTNDRFCKGVAVGDFDNDGDLDLYVSNVGRNRLYRNDGLVDGDVRFTDVAESLGVQGPTGYSFATWFFDYNNDGWLDLFVAAYRTDTGDLMAEARGLPHKGVSPRLYLNLGKDAAGRVRFEDVTSRVGLDRPFLPMGANFGDLDNDGFLDIYLATGEPDYGALMPNVMLRNDAGRRFQNVTFSGGLGHLQKGHGVAFADVDNDGDQDIYHQLGGFLPGDKFHNALFLNPGHGNRHLVVRLVGTKSNRAAIGARIEVEVRDEAGGARVIHRAVGAVSSFGGSPLRQEIGLGKAARIERVTITWPIDGAQQTLKEVPLDSTIRVTEGQNGFRVVPRKRILFSPDTSVHQPVNYSGWPRFRRITPIAPSIGLCVSKLRGFRLRLRKFPLANCGVFPDFHFFRQSQENVELFV